VQEGAHNGENKRRKKHQRKGRVARARQPVQAKTKSKENPGTERTASKKGCESDCMHDTMRGVKSIASVGRSCAFGTGPMGVLEDSASKEGGGMRRRDPEGR
jgi:hypothetical protein